MPKIIKFVLLFVSFCFVFYLIAFNKYINLKCHHSFIETVYIKRLKVVTLKLTNGENSDAVFITYQFMYSKVLHDTHMTVQIF
jgi:hypothetical protein